MKVKNDHRSKFSNLSNWREEAWKKSELQRDSNPWPPRCRCVALPTERLENYQWKLENLLQWSFFTFIYNRSSKMNYFIYFTSLSLLSKPVILKINLWLISHLSMFKWFVMAIDSTRWSNFGSWVPYGS